MIGHREGHRVAGAHFRFGFGDMLQVLRPDVAAVNDNKVFLAAGDGEYPVHQVADIAGVQPAVRIQCVAGFFRQVEVAGHHAGAAQVDDAAVPVVQHRLIAIANLDFEFRQGHAAIDEVAPATGAVTFFEQHGPVIVRQLVAVDVVGGKTGPQGRETDPEGALGHAVAGKKSAAVEAAGLQQFGKVRQGVGAYHFGTDTRHPPVAQVIAGEVVRPHPAGAQVVAERGRKGDGRAGLGHQFQPLARAHGEFAGVQVVDRDLRRHRHQHETHQAHVVVEGQPGHHAIIAVHLQAVADDAAQVGHRGFVLDHDAARKARAAGGVLDIGDVGRLDPGQRQLAPGQRVERRRHIDHAQGQALAGFLQKRQVALGGYRNGGVARLQQALQLGHVGQVCAHLDRGRQGHGQQAGVLAGVEKAEEIRVGFGHQGHAAAGLQAQAQQLAGQFDRLLAQLPVGH